jgi:uncharacterized membrane protein
MVNTTSRRFECPICKVTRPYIEGRSADLVHSPVGSLIRQQYPDWDSNPIICLSCLNRFRTQYVGDSLEAERGELSALETAVIESFREQELLSRNTASEFDEKLTFGDRTSDRVAGFGGSWRFIIIFGVVLAAWIAVNSIVLFKKPFDPYPYILMNLILSCLAALQAPIIMMSQNRQDAKDRLRSEHDYQVNLKSEIEIRQLHIKLDQLINHSWQRLLEIQKIQMELIREISTDGPEQSQE